MPATAWTARRRSGCLSAAADVDISQVVDPVKGVPARIRIADPEG